MTHCTTLSSASLFYFERKQPSNQQSFFSTSFKTICSISTQSSGFESSLSGKSGLGIDPSRVPLRPAVSLETSNYIHQIGRADLTLESPDDVSNGTVKQLLSNSDGAAGLMKMERRSKLQDVQSTRWFPYLDEFKAGGTNLSSGEILEVLDPYIVEARKEKFRNVVKNRTYSVCLVLEDLSDLTNVSAVLRSADALGFQSVHVISGDSSKRYRGHRHVSKGAERWLDIELWKSTNECYRVLKSRGYRIAATHVGMGTGMGMEVSINDMDWSCPTAIVFGNETRGITDEALDLSDLRCSVPMRGMVNSLNVAAAANIFMYHAVCDRTSFLGYHGDLTLEQRQILVAEFSLRHKKAAINIVHMYAKQKAATPMPKL